MIDDLKKVRELKIQLRHLGEERERLAPSLKSPKFDGMPRCGSGGGLDAQIDMRAELDDRIHRAECEAMEAEKRAREQMTALTPDLYSLCSYYYIAAMTIKETVSVMNISRTTFYRMMERLKVVIP